MRLSYFFKRRDVDFLAAAVLTAPAFWVMGPSQSVGYFLEIVAMSWVLLLVIYAFNRWTEDEARGFGVGLMLWVLGGGAFAALLVPLPNSLARGAAIAIVAVGVLYSIHLPGKNGTYQLRQVYLLKPLMICGAHSIQWLAFTGRLDLWIALLLAWHFFDIFVLANLFDALDVREDKAAGANTLAVVHGFKRAIEVAWVANVVCISLGILFVVLSGSIWFALFLLPRPFQMQRKLDSLRRGKKVGKGIPVLLVRAVGTAGIVLHYIFGPAWPPLI